MNKIKISESLRLGYAGAWCHSHSELSQHLSHIQTQCPNLTDAFMLSDEDGLVDSDSDSSGITFKGFCDAKAWFETSQLISVPFPDFSSLGDNYFIKKLRQEFAKSYGVKNIDILSMCGIEFWANLDVNGRQGLLLLTSNIVCSNL